MLDARTRHDGPKAICTELGRTQWEVNKVYTFVET